jgi:putative endonuclease
MRIHKYFVYILTTKHNKILYVGVTNDIVRRLEEHKTGFYGGFTHKYNIKKLVYFEVFDYIDQAIAREKQIKAYSRLKKDNLINSKNPFWVEIDPGAKCCLSF